MLTRTQTYPEQFCKEAAGHHHAMLQNHDHKDFEVFERNSEIGFGSFKLLQSFSVRGRVCDPFRVPGAQR